MFQAGPLSILSFENKLTQARSDLLILLAIPFIHIPFLIWGQIAEFIVEPTDT